MDDDESEMAVSLRHETRDIIAISWERIANETASDPTMRLLLDTIHEGFTYDRRAANADIAAIWTYRESLNVTDGVILYRDRVVVLPSLCDKVLRILHSAHQGVSSTESRARSIVFRPGCPMTSGLSEYTALPVTGQPRHNQSRPRSRRQSLQPRSNQYSQTV